MTFELPPGTAVGKYEVLRKLATGGMAEIYLARISGTAGFEKLVVLKRILPNLAADPTFVSMFLDEARLAATLQHPNIADVYDVGEADGAYFFTMEYVHGQDVRMIRGATRRRNEAVPLAMSLAIVHGAALALDYAHSKVGNDGRPLGLVHRDVSPSNIMVSYDGAVKLLDFGIARASSSAHKTQVGTLKGKIPYMSPEQCKSQSLDRTSDLFSLGIVLYELTVGRRPFRGESDFEVMDQIVHKGATPPSAVVTGYPAALEAIVMKLLATTPEKRYAGGEDLLHDLDELIGGSRLWLSARHIGKYMRGVFGDRIDAWERAQAQGVPFIEHVAQTITSRSQRSELQTPTFSAIPHQSGADRSTPVPSYSKPMGAMTSQAMKALDLDVDVEMEIERAAPPTPPAITIEPQDVELRPRSGKVIAIAFLVTLFLGGGAFGAYLLTHQQDDAATSAAATPTPPPPVVVEPTKPPPVVAPTRAPAAPPPPPPIAKEPVVEDPEPAVEDPKPTVADKTTPAPTRPVRRPPRRVGGKAPKVDPKTKQPDPSKEPTWDPNSPFLPQ